MPALPFAVPIESLRCGGLPADDGYQRPFDPAEQDERLRDQVAELRARRGRHEDGAVATSSFDGPGGLIFTPRPGVPRKLPQCADCGLPFISRPFLDAHRERDHPPENGRGIDPAPAEQDLSDKAPGDEPG